MSLCPVSKQLEWAPGIIHFYTPIPIFAVGCTIASYNLEAPRLPGRCDVTCRSWDLTRPPLSANMSTSAYIYGAPL